MAFSSRGNANNSKSHNGMAIHGHLYFITTSLTSFKETDLVFKRIVASQADVLTTNASFNDGMPETLPTTPLVG